MYPKLRWYGIRPKLQSGPRGGAGLSAAGSLQFHQFTPEANWEKGGVSIPPTDEDLHSVVFGSAPTRYEASCPAIVAAPRSVK